MFLCLHCCNSSQNRKFSPNFQPNFLKKIDLACLSVCLSTYLSKLGSDLLARMSFINNKQPSEHHVLPGLRPILNFDPRGKLWPQGWSCPPGVNFVPWVWSYPLGVKFSVHPSILLDSMKRVFTPGGERRGEHVSCGTNFTPGGQGWS
jgi:hypothetical protein